MSVKTEMMVFDARLYEDVILAAWTSAKKGKPAPLLKILRRAASQAPEEHTEQIRLRQREMQRFVRAIKDAERRSDTAGVEEAKWRLYELANEEDEYVGISRSAINEEIKTIESERFDLADLSQVASAVELLCIPRDRGVRTKIDVSSLGLEHYLSKHSDVFRRAFGVQTPHVTLAQEVASSWESAWWLEGSEVRMLREDLAKIPAPREPLMRRALSLVQELLDTVLAEPGFVLLIAQTM